MSKIPVDKNGKLRTLELRGVYSTTKLKNSDAINAFDETKAADGAGRSQNAEVKPQNNVKDQSFCKTYVSFIPKMSLNIEKVIEKNPRILDLREKLNQITKKQDCNVDKKTKGLINDITQQLVDKTDEEESGPYSLLFELQSDTATTSLHDSAEVNIWNRPKSEVLSEGNIVQKKFNPINRSADKLANVLNFDEKPMREFEYFCEKECNIPAKKTFGTHSRSDLCLQLKSHVHPRIFESNLSPNDNSLSRTNEENSLDDSLGILTPDQMDDICYLENAFSPTVEGLPIFCDSERKISPDNGETPSTDKTESNSAASTIQNDGFDSIESKKCSLEDQIAPIVSVEKIITSDDHNSIPPLDSIQIQTNETLNNEISLPLPKADHLSTHVNAKEESACTLIDDEFLPSMHSSILEPVSSIAENIANLEIALNCKHENLVITNRIEQTPSPEDLPLDSSEINGEISTYSQFSASTLHDSQTFSDGKNDYPKSMETSKVSNSFITSITSITSLDGYQGDGEMSRPVSRGADHSIEHREDVIEMDWPNVPVPRRADPMTDSDFFTESDADGLDDHMQKGDRRAQVIDGALYGGKKTNGNPPLIVNRNEDSCMESSGVYTDFENHRTSPVFLNVIDDMSPDGSTPSTRSECSQKNVSTNSINAYFSPLQDVLAEQKVETSHVPDNDETPKNASKRSSLNSVKDLKSSEKKEEKRSFTLKKYKMPKRDVPSKLKSMLASRKPEVDSSVQNSPKTVKKTERRENLAKKNSLDVKNDYKKSFKDIKSKVDCSFSLQRSQTSCSVSRMLSSKSTNNNVKPKSRHMRMRMDLGSATGSGKSSLHSSQSDISASSTPLGKHATSRFPLLRNGKKRESAPTPTTPRPPPPATPPTPQNVQTKKNGVVQKLSSSPVSVRARTSLAPPPSPRKAPPHRVPAQRPSTLPTNKEPPRVTAAVGPRGKRVQTPQPVKSPPVAAPAPQPAQPREQAAALAHAAKGVEALGVIIQYLVFRLDALNGSTWRKEAERWRGVAAAERTSATRADRDRQQRAQKDLDTIAECLSKISELEMEVSSKEEANARLQAKHVEEVAALATDIKGLKDTIESLKHEVAESRARLHAHSEIERTLRAQLEAARAELDCKKHDDSCDTLRDTSCETSLDASFSTSRDVSCDTSFNTSRDVSCDTSYNASYTMCDAACDPVCCEAEDCELRLAANVELSTDANELAAEVRSLRAVVELKQAEIASLRDARTELSSERARRAAAEREARAARHAAEELRERATARARDADRLRDDHRRLRDQAARDRDQAARLAALNEELRYKLRQKSQVVSLLAGGGYVERASLRTRTSSNESGRSSPAPDSPPSPAASPAPDTPPLPAVKGVVEKHDSVSWVLEIEETPEEVASRLARRSSFRAAASPGGVKRRGGGSPGGGSPAPASPAPNASKLFRPGDLDFPPPPPPLKESAGEAIYIYDDRQY